VQITEDDSALREVMRVRGYSIMKNILEDYSTDSEILVLVGPFFGSLPFAVLTLHRRHHLEYR
jgi:hypothetical protein